MNIDTTKLLKLRSGSEIRGTVEALTDEVARKYIVGGRQQAARLGGDT